MRRTFLAAIFLLGFPSAAGAMEGALPGSGSPNTTLLPEDRPLSISPSSGEAPGGSTGGGSLACATPLDADDSRTLIDIGRNYKDDTDTAPGPGDEGTAYTGAVTCDASRKQCVMTKLSAYSAASPGEPIAADDAATVLGIMQRYPSSTDDSGESVAAAITCVSVFKQCYVRKLITGSSR